MSSTLVKKWLAQRLNEELDGLLLRAGADVLAAAPHAPLATDWATGKRVQIVRFLAAASASGACVDVSDGHHIVEAALLPACVATLEAAAGQPVTTFRGGTIILKKCRFAFQLAVGEAAKVCLEVAEVNWMGGNQSGAVSDVPLLANEKAAKERLKDLAREIKRAKYVAMLFACRSG